MLSHKIAECPERKRPLVKEWKIRNQNRDFRQHGLVPVNTQESCLHLKYFNIIVPLSISSGYIGFKPGGNMS